MSKKSGKYSLVKNHYLCTLMKKIFILNLLFLLALSPAQENTAKKALYVKGNILSLAVLMPNFGLEYQLSSKFTLQGDVFISPWKTFAGRHMQVYMGHMEGRYYFREAFKGWYVGANAGMAVYDISKWNYTSERYQRGFNYMLGAAVGYQLQWAERWNVDFFLGGGTSQGFYHGYEQKEEGISRYEKSAPWNKSGEWIPYRGGVMISYKLR